MVHGKKTIILFHKFWNYLKSYKWVELFLIFGSCFWLQKTWSSWQNKSKGGRKKVVKLPKKTMGRRFPKPSFMEIFDEHCSKLKNKFLRYLFFSTILVIVWLNLFSSSYFLDFLHFLAAPKLNCFVTTYSSLEKVISSSFVSAAWEPWRPFVVELETLVEKAMVDDIVWAYKFFGSKFVYFFFRSINNFTTKNCFLVMIFFHSFQKKKYGVPPKASFCLSLSFSFSLSLSLSLSLSCLLSLLRKSSCLDLILFNCLGFCKKRLKKRGESVFCFSTNIFFLRMEIDWNLSVNHGEILRGSSPNPILDFAPKCEYLFLFLCWGGIYSPNGLDVFHLLKLKQNGNSLVDLDFNTFT